MIRLFRNSLFAVLILFVLFAFPQMLAFAENIGDSKKLLVGGEAG